MSKKSLAKIVGDMADLKTFIANDDFLMVVNQEPPQHFVKDHPLAKGVKYIPIDKVELMLTKIFQQWYVEILRESVMLNAISVTVRLHYKHPVTDEWHYQDGVGAVGIQTDAGKSASDLAAIKQNAVMLALPAAKSFAMKDAAEHIGKVFGRDLNRKDTMAFTPSYSTQQGKVLLTKQRNAVKESLGVHDENSKA